MTVPTATRVDTLVVYPNSWSAESTASFMGELELADARLHQILHNSNNNWLTFPKVGVVRWSQDPVFPMDYSILDPLRAQYGADRVVLVVDEYPTGGGAMLCGPYATVRRAVLGGLYAHELFHTVCLDHEEETALTPPEGLENNRAMYVCPDGGGDGFAAYMTQSSPCGWYSAERVTGPGVFYNDIELVGPNQQATLVLQVAAPLAAAEMDAPLGPCVPSNTVMCLDSSNNSLDKRFELQVEYNTVLGGGRSGFGTPSAIPGSTESGLFSFFTESNKEMLVKIINGCELNSYFWVFYGTTTNVGFTLTIRDTLTQEVTGYTNFDLNFGQIGDITAFPCN
ncbi:MAG: hypothetical protein AAB458_02335 [Patescibacteria group bacterium]